MRCHSGKEWPRGLVGARQQIDWFHTSILAALAFAIKAGIGPAIREMFTRQWRRHVVSAFCIYPLRKKECNYMI